MPESESIETVGGARMLNACTSSMLPDALGYSTLLYYTIRYYPVLFYTTYCLYCIVVWHAMLCYAIIQYYTLLLLLVSKLPSSSRADGPMGHAFNREEAGGHDLVFSSDCWLDAGSYVHVY